MSPRQRAARVHRGSYLKLFGPAEQRQVFVLQSTIDSKVSTNLVMKAASQKPSQNKGGSADEDQNVQALAKPGKEAEGKAQDIEVFRVTVLTVALGGCLTPLQTLNGYKHAHLHDNTLSIAVFSMKLGEGFLRGRLFQLLPTAW